jgi:RNA polymerase sigma-70 factor (ECF subfamily)
MSTRELVEKYVEENHDEFVSFIKTTLYSKDPEDIAQELYLRLIRTDSSIKNTENLSGLMKSSARNLSYNRFKKDNSFVRDRVDCDLNFKPDEEPKELTELIEQCRAAVDSLEEPYRTTATMFYLDEEPILAIAKKLRIPEGTVKRRLFEARARLKVKLEAFMSND